MAKILIFDGQTKDTLVIPRAGYAPLWIKFRPALPEEAKEFLSTPNINSRDYVRTATKFIQGHLLDWDAEGEKDGKAEIAGEVGAKNITRIPYPYLESLLNEICGFGSAWTTAIDPKN